jgi:hypothetical protein
MLTVRLDQAVGSEISQPGQRSDAPLAEPVEVDGRIIAANTWSRSSE